jgi:type I restriction enzyme M protein
VLYRSTESVFLRTKRMLLDECDLYYILSLPPGVFTAAGAGVKTNLLFFTKGRPIERVWYYDLSDVKVGKKTPLTIVRFEEFSTMLPARANGPRSWIVSREEIERRNFDLKATNPNARSTQDTRTPEELLDIIVGKGREVDEALGRLRRNLMMEVG